MKRASGSVVEALGSFFLASSLACLLARDLRSASSRSSASRALAARSLTSRAARSRAAWRRRFEAHGSSSSSRLRAASHSATAASTLSSLSPVLNDALWRWRESSCRRRRSRPASPAPRRSAPSRLASTAGRGLPPARPGSRRSRDSYAARRPPASGKRRRFARAAPVRAPSLSLRPWRRATAPREPQDRRPAGPPRPRASEPDRKAPQDRGSRQSSTPRALGGPMAEVRRDRSCPSAIAAGPAAPPELRSSPIRLTEVSDRESQPDQKSQFLHTLESGHDNRWFGYSTGRSAGWPEKKP